MTVNAGNLQQLHKPPWLHSEGIVKMWNGPLKTTPQTVLHAYCTQTKTITFLFRSSPTGLYNAYKLYKVLEREDSFFLGPILTTLHSPFTHSLEFSGRPEQTEWTRCSALEMRVGLIQISWDLGSSQAVGRGGGGLEKEILCAWRRGSGGLLQTLGMHVRMHTHKNTLTACPLFDSYIILSLFTQAVSQKKKHCCPDSSSWAPEDMKTS